MKISINGSTAESDDWDDFRREEEYEDAKYEREHPDDDPLSQAMGPVNDDIPLFSNEEPAEASSGFENVSATPFNVPDAADGPYTVTCSEKNDASVFKTADLRPALIIAGMYQIKDNEYSHASVVRDGVMLYDHDMTHEVFDGEAKEYDGYIKDKRKLPGNERDKVLRKAVSESYDATENMSARQKMKTINNIRLKREQYLNRRDKDLARYDNEPGRVSYSSEKKALSVKVIHAGQTVYSQSLDEKQSKEVLSHMQSMLDLNDRMVNDSTAQSQSDSPAYNANMTDGYMYSIEHNAAQILSETIPDRIRRQYHIRDNAGIEAVQDAVDKGLSVNGNALHQENKLPDLSWLHGKTESEVVFE